jgi:hypothetical protein
LLAVVFFGNLDKYFEDLQNYEDELYCSNCGNDRKHLIISELLLMESLLVQKM